MMAKRKKNLLRVSKSVETADNMPNTLIQLKKRLDESVTSVTSIPVETPDSPITPSISTDGLSIDCDTTVESGIAVSPVSPIRQLEPSYAICSEAVPIHYKKQKAVRTQSDIANQNNLTCCLDESNDYYVHDKASLDT